MSGKLTDRLFANSRYFTKGVNVWWEWFPDRFDGFGRLRRKGRYVKGFTIKARGRTGARARLALMQEQRR